MIPFIIGGLVVLGGKIFQEGGRIANKDTEEEISKVNSDIYDIIEKTEMAADIAKKKCDVAVDKLMSTKQNIYKTTFKRFESTANQIDNIDFNSKVGSMNKAREIEVEGIDFKRVHAKSFLTSGVTGVVNFVFTPPAIGIVSQMAYSFKLDNLLEEAKAEKSKVKVQCEVIKTECHKMNSITALLKTTNTTVNSLNKLADKSIDRMDEIIKEYGTDYSLYPEDCKRDLMLCYNLIGAVSDLLNTEIVNQKGEINKDFKKFVKQIKIEYLEAKNG